MMTTKQNNIAPANFDAIKVASDGTETQVGAHSVDNYTDLAAINSTFGVSATSYTRSGYGNEEINYFGGNGEWPCLILLRN